MRPVLSGMLLALVVGCGRSLDADSVALFNRAQQAFDSAQTPTEYLLAASQFQVLVDHGVESGEVFYNQGNAYMRGNQRGRAIACYRQAERYRPRDPHLAANLEFALGTESPRQSRPLLEYVLFWQGWLSYPAKFRFSLVSAVVTLGFALAGLWSPQAVWKKGALILLIGSLLLACSAIYDWYRFEYVRHGVITSREATARKGNADTYEPAFTAPLPEGTEFTVVEQRGTWLLVRLPAGEEGWVPALDAVTY